jgi:tRNA threonylcarbamoyladenosine biosynthesis protein TsaB
MSLILNIESATTVCSVAIGKDGKAHSFKETNKGYTHAENLTFFIQELLEENKLKLQDFDAIAISKGPGSYTGLRIGAATAKGICYSLNKPLIAIDTLKSLAASKELPTYNFQLPTLYCPMLDARRMEVYCALYNSDRNEVMPSTAKVIDENSFSEELKKGKVVFFGDGAQKCKTLLAVSNNAIFVDDIFPSAKNMCALSHEAFEKKQFENTAYFEPSYLKEFYTQAKS